MLRPKIMYGNFIFVSTSGTSLVEGWPKMATTASSVPICGDVATKPKLRFAWLEITGKCQLACDHCYAESLPQGNHGLMSTANWKVVINQLAEMGVPTVQFIGGEPTLHPDFELLVRYALSRQLDVEVFTNLVKVTPALWNLFENRHVQLATSYYTDDAAEHTSITHGVNAHKLTTANIAETVQRRIPLRVGVIDVQNGQRHQEAVEMLQRMGVTNIGHDKLRQVGRGIRTGKEGIEELCGRCVSGVIAISPDGLVWPCVFARFLPVGNVMLQTLQEMLEGSTYSRVASRLTTEFASRKPQVPLPSACRPNEPCYPVIQCEPIGDPPKVAGMQPYALSTN